MKIWKVIGIGVSIIAIVVGATALATSIATGHPRDRSTETDHPRENITENATAVYITHTISHHGVNVNGIPYQPEQKMLKPIKGIPRVSVSPQSRTINSTGTVQISTMVTVSGSVSGTVNIPLTVSVDTERVFINAEGDSETARVFIYAKNGPISELRTIDVLNASAVFKIVVKP